MKLTVSYHLRPEEVGSLPVTRQHIPSAQQPWGKAETGCNFVPHSLLHGLYVQSFLLEKRTGPRGGEYLFLSVTFTDQQMVAPLDCRPYLKLLAQQMQPVYRWQVVVYRKDDEVRICGRERMNAVKKVDPQTSFERPMKAVVL